MLFSLQCMVQNTTHAFPDGPGACPLPSLRTAVSSCSRSPLGRKGGGALEAYVRPSLAQWARAPQGSGMWSHRPTPAAPLSLFTPPHSWQCPSQRWPGAQRGRAERGSAFPLVAPPRGSWKREGRARALEPEPKGRWAET